jgi:acyl carrier protein
LTVTVDDVMTRMGEVLSLPLDRLTPDCLLADIVADSLALVELAVDLQEECDVFMDQHDLRQISTVGDLAGLLDARMRGGPAGARDLVDLPT